MSEILLNGHADRRLRLRQIFIAKDTMKVQLINPPQYFSTYLNPVLIDGDRWAAILELIGYRGRILVGKWSDLSSYSAGY